MSVSASPSPDSSTRPAVSPFALNVAVAIYLMALCNQTFWGHLFRIFEGHTVTALIFAAAIWALTFLVIAFIAVRRAQKPVLVALLLIAAITSYYMDALGVVIDRDMIQNAATTTVAESKHLITPAFLLHVLLYGVLPSAVVLWVRIRRTGIWRSLAGWTLVNSLATALVIGLLFSNYKDFSSVLREDKELLASVQPLAPISGAVRYVRMLMKSRDIVLQPTGTDAKAGPYLAAATKPVLLVIVAGETGRAASWSLGGYGRETNPELAKRDIAYFSDVSSCGTATATSLPCMFSPLTRAEYSYEAGLSHENLLDVMARAGFKVEWWDNNTGNKGIAARLPSRFMTAVDGAEFCTPECIDAVFLKRLQDTAATITQNTVIVLHQIGSHGPSYWLRYPADREVFKPTCQTPEVMECSAEEIVNAYDNTIAYTDWFLAQVIDMLDGQDRVIPAMFYVSDHGESLGENGIYLHGTPYFMAPTEQTHVPMVLWMAERYQAALGLPQDCLKERQAKPASHDNVFSTILGMADISTTARDDALDLAAGCRARGS
ncbi:phosphoethanolamine transferase [Tabrizicola sp. BL-A-41-H6]|uniref:phosphoethanolamine transferase n=1 Tax=Tabrizicola sp. BL-A-41-H6 TaxID=3421107 RepID=UPI003D664B98